MRLWLSILAVASQMHEQKKKSEAFIVPRKFKAFAVHKKNLGDTVPEVLFRFNSMMPD
jgi:hypothetical protein